MAFQCASALKVDLVPELATPRPLILVLDVSGSMSSFFNLLKAMMNVAAEAGVSGIILFSCDSITFLPASDEYNWTDIYKSMGGTTNTKSAVESLCALVQKLSVPNPRVLLVTDGIPSIYPDEASLQLLDEVFHHPPLPSVAEELQRCRAMDVRESTPRRYSGPYSKMAFVPDSAEEDEVGPQVAKYDLEDSRSNITCVYLHTGLQGDLGLLRRMAGGRPPLVVEGVELLPLLQSALGSTLTVEQDAIGSRFGSCKVVKASELAPSLPCITSIRCLATGLVVAGAIVAYVESHSTEYALCRRALRDALTMLSALRDAQGPVAKRKVDETPQDLVNSLVHQATSLTKLVDNLRTMLLTVNRGQVQAVETRMGSSLHAIFSAVRLIGSGESRPDRADDSPFELCPTEVSALLANLRIAASHKPVKAVRQAAKAAFKLNASTGATASKMSKALDMLAGDLTDSRPKCALVCRTALPARNQLVEPTSSAGMGLTAVALNPACLQVQVDDVVWRGQGLTADLDGRVRLIFEVDGQLLADDKLVCSMELAFGQMAGIVTVNGPLALCSAFLAEQPPSGHVQQVLLYLLKNYYYRRLRGSENPFDNVSSLFKLAYSTTSTLTGLFLPLLQVAPQAAMEKAVQALLPAVARCFKGHPQYGLDRLQQMVLQQAHPVWKGAFDALSILQNDNPASAAQEQLQDFVIPRPSGLLDYVEQAFRTKSQCPPPIGVSSQCPSFEQCRSVISMLLPDVDFPAAMETVAMRLAVASLLSTGHAEKLVDLAQALDSSDLVETGDSWQLAKGLPFRLVEEAVCAAAVTSASWGTLPALHRLQLAKRFRPIDLGSQVQACLPDLHHSVHEAIEVLDGQCLDILLAGVDVVPRYLLEVPAALAWLSLASLASPSPLLVCERQRYLSNLAQAVDTLILADQASHLVATHLEVLQVDELRQVLSSLSLVIWRPPALHHLKSLSGENARFMGLYILAFPQVPVDEKFCHHLLSVSTHAQFLAQCLIDRGDVYELSLQTLLSRFKFPISLRVQSMARSWATEIYRRHAPPLPFQMDESHALAFLTRNNARGLYYKHPELREQGPFLTVSALVAARRTLLQLDPKLLLSNRYQDHSRAALALVHTSVEIRDGLVCFVLPSEI